MASIIDRQTDGLESSLNKVAERLLTQEKQSIRLTDMETTTITAAPASAPTPSPQTSLKAAYAKFTQTQRGTSSHDQAWEELVDVLFANAK